MDRWTDAQFVFNFRVNKADIPRLLPLYGFDHIRLRQHLDVTPVKFLYLLLARFAFPRRLDTLSATLLDCCLEGSGVSEIAARELTFYVNVLWGGNGSSKGTPSKILVVSLSFSRGHIATV
ncbi:hypothetical protein MMC13_004583 [Lambiella insularis]|nr:hypothetical protein [Lambiella insularis]